MKILVISAHYPNSDYIYGDVFVHTRLMKYKKYFDVVVVGYNPALANDRKYTYEGISVCILKDLKQFFATVTDERADIIVGHLIQHDYIDFLIDLKKPLVIFIHGYEATSWKRRLMNYNSVGAIRYLLPYMISNTKQLSKLKKLVRYSNGCTDVKFVFVSNWIKNAVQHDLGVSVKHSYVIPNGIDVDLFNFERKSNEHRKKILLIRSFKARNYANDMAIEAILEASKKEFFKELEVSIYGEGYLFKPLTDRLKHLPNVTINNFFIENKDIPAVHKRFGIFLCPSRLDTQGVSMCEAMSSGLVPITTAIGGIPEYCTNDKSGFLTDGIDKIVSKIQFLYENPDVFLQMSSEARNSINKNCNVNEVVLKEIEVINYISKGGSSMSEKDTSYKQCTQCVLDTNDDSSISFDDKGVCSYCTSYKKQEKVFIRTGQQGKMELDKIVHQIKKLGAHSRYDCIIGLSGGVDSTYVCYQAKKFGLRPLIVHFDNGWNSELAVSNIEKTISVLGFDLHTLVIQWEEFRDLQLAFLKASVIDIEMITDHAIIATLYKLALEYNIKFILSGTNIVTEGILPLNWIHHKADYIHIRALQKQFVGKPFKTYPLFNIPLRVKAEMSGIQSVSLLNYIDYNKEQAKKEMISNLGWRDYGGKHYESIFTRFYQGYILPVKFKVDKRKAHLSTLICSGQISRDEAINELSKPMYDADLLRSDYEFVLKKLGLKNEEFEEIMAAPPKPHSSYPFETNIYERVPILKFFQPLWRTFKNRVR